MQPPTCPETKGKTQFPNFSHFQNSIFVHFFQPTVVIGLFFLSWPEETLSLNWNKSLHWDMTKLSTRYLEEAHPAYDPKDHQVSATKFIHQVQDRVWHCLDLCTLQYPHSWRVHHVCLEPLVAWKVLEMCGLPGPAYRHVLRQERQHLLQRRLLQVGKQND